MATSQPHSRADADVSRDADAELLDSIRAALRGVRFGSVEIVIHDARVVQIIKTEKLRIDR